LWGQRPHYLRVGPVEIQVSVELATAAIRQFQRNQSACENLEEALSILTAIFASQFIFLDVATDEPIPQREPEVNRVARPAGEIIMNRTNLSNELFEVHAPLPLRFRHGTAFELQCGNRDSDAPGRASAACESRVPFRSLPSIRVS
jgi:hypothetical protein